jgi:diadenosine tetraphosphatase ApaH/serine/threonine PP2A family protein phosphatase
MRLALPDFCLAIVVASVEHDASAFAGRHFAADSAALFADTGWRCSVADRLRRRQLAVVAGRAAARDLEAAVHIAKQHHARPVAICIGGAGEHGGRQAHGERLPSPRRLEAMGFRAGFALTQREAGQVEIEREPLACDRRDLAGPFDIIGDIHGCAGELCALLRELGYSVELKARGAERRARVSGPGGRRAIFVGDFVDRGPNAPDVLRIAMAMVQSGLALAVPGNHDAKLQRWLRGSRVALTHGLDLTVHQLERETPHFRTEVLNFLARLPVHLWLEGGGLVVTHAGIREDMIGREDGAVRRFCLYGDTDPGVDELGLPLRYHWAAYYRGSPAVIYGHTPVPEAGWVNNTLCIDTGCCFGGRLTALRWPEREIVSVPAVRTYAEPRRPFGHPPVRPAGRPPDSRPQEGTGAG